jgi:ADP-ribosylglycohydrolase
MSVHNLLSGKHWSESGIAGSYGNGTAMRAAPFGVFFRKDLQSLITAVKIDSAITHASDEAEAGALAIALAAFYAVNNDTDNLLEKIWVHLPDSKVKVSIYGLESLVNSDKITPQQALRVLGTKADVRETVPSALYCFIKSTSYHQSILHAIKAGGDTDTTAAIVGALAGIKFGMGGINREFYVIEDFDKLIQLDSQLYNKSSCKYF